MPTAKQDLFCFFNIFNFLECVMLLFENEKDLQSYKVTPKRVIPHISAQFLNSLKHLDLSFLWGTNVTIFLKA